jgi:pimeloyl-ACP methyl ester carboxylesterase
MALSEVLGERGTVEVPAGTLEYREGGSGPPVVFAHGAGVNGDLWRKVAPDLAGEHRCIALDLPLGGHSIPLSGEPDMSLFGCADILANFLETLDLSDVTLVANDTGGAIAQALAASRAERIGRLVLTSCDAFENYPPKAVAYLKPTARVRPALWLLTQSMRLKPLQRLPIAYGWATHQPIEPRIMDSYLTSLRTNAGVRRDFARLLRAADSRDTLRAAEGLRGFDRPALGLGGRRQVLPERARAAPRRAPAARPLRARGRLAYVHPRGQPGAARGAPARVPRRAPLGGSSRPHRGSRGHPRPGLSGSRGHPRPGLNLR